MNDTVSKLAKPSWPTPDPEGDWMLYFGNIFNRNTLYKGPWDDEKKYCRVKSVFNFCGLQEEHFYKSLQKPYKTEILFRRFQCDGKFLAKFEIGFNDNFESQLKAGGIPPEEYGNAFYEHINKYLLCPLKIKIGTRLSEFVPLIHCGSYLANAYFWSSYKASGKRTFDGKITSAKVSKCDPVILVQLDSSQCDLSFMASKKVEKSDWSEESFSLYYDHITHKYRGGFYHIRTWFISARANMRNLPIQPGNFTQYSDTIRYLRINLLRIHCDRAILKKVLERIGDPGDNFQTAGATTQKRVLLHLQTILKNLSKTTRNNQQQEELVNIAFKVDDLINEENLESQIEGLKLTITWLQNYIDRNQNVIYFSQQIIQNMGDQITIGTLSGTFINKSTLANSLNTATTNGLDDASRKELLEIAKMIEDSHDLAAASLYNQFTEEVAKPKEKQDKSKLKQFWDGLVKILPDVATVGKAIAGVVALF